MIEQFESRSDNEGEYFNVGSGCPLYSGHPNNLRVRIDSKVGQSCMKLRYDYFVVKRGWVEMSDKSSNCETDRYDEHSHHIAVFDGIQPLAYVRALPHVAGVGFMLDKEFASILPDSESETIEREGAVELSRFVVSSLLKDRRKAWPIHPVESLLKALYHLSRDKGYSRFYIVVEDGWPQVFARRFGLPFKVLGNSYTFPDGTRTVAAVATLEELEAGMRQHSAAKYDWYQKRGDD